MTVTSSIGLPHLSQGGLLLEGGLSGGSGTRNSARMVFNYATRCLGSGCLP
jgi:hypothetical protein